MIESVGKNKLLDCRDLFVKSDEKHIFFNEKVHFAFKLLLIFRQIDIN